MPIFEYKALDASGKSTRGTIEADSAKTARSRLKKNGLYITAIDEKGSSASSKGSDGPQGSSLSFFTRIKINDIALFTRQLSSLLKANIPLVEGLTALIDQTENEKLRECLSLVRQDVNEGTSLAKALQKHPKAFNNVYINMIEAGEASGTLPLVLIRLADFLESQVRLKNKVSSAMMYPILMMTVAVALVFGIFVFVMPKIAGIFTATNKPLPIQTRILLSISDFMVVYWYLPLMAGIGAFVFANRYIATKEGRRQWDALLLKLPIFGPLVRMLAVARFASSMSTLLTGGVPILTSMNIVKHIVGNTLIMEAIDKAKDNVTEGQSIAEPLKRSRQFPPLVIHMIAIGERTGELPQMLVNVASTYEEQVSNRIEGLTSLLEPVMILFMGGIVGFIVFSIFMPMLELNNLR